MTETKRPAIGGGSGYTGDESVSDYTSRYTDADTVELINRVYPGKMNKFIGEEL